MSEAVLEQAPAEVKPLTPSEVYTKVQADRAAAAAKPAEGETQAEASAETPKPEKRASGDERKFRRQLQRRDQEIGALRARIEALTPKEQAAAAAAAPATDAPPKRADFATDDEFRQATIAYEVKRARETDKAEEANQREIRETIDGYNARMAAAPEKYPDWAEVLEQGKGAALSVDLGKECPSLFWAIAKSPYNDDCFYHWLKDSSQLQKLIDTYKSGPKGELDALAAFHRFEGKVGRDAKAEEKKEPAKKADDAVARAPKPKPSAEASVRGGETAPDGAPPIYLKGTHTINPAWQIWRRNRNK
jgi:hypothetical protein